MIHLAVGKVYLKNNKIENKKDFEKGIIEPDRKEDKVKSHYGPYSSQPDLNAFVSTNELTSSYEEGYFLHLVTDYLFYNKLIKRWDATIYEDYDKLNEKIKNRYEIEIPKEIQEIVQFKTGKLSLLKEEELYKFIDAVGKINLRQILLQRESDCKRELERQVDEK